MVETGVQVSIGIVLMVPAEEAVAEVVDISVVRAMQAMEGMAGFMAVGALVLDFKQVVEELRVQLPTGFLSSLTRRQAGLLWSQCVHSWE